MAFFFFLFFFFFSRSLEWAVEIIPPPRFSYSRSTDLLTRCLEVSCPSIFVLKSECSPYSCRLVNSVLPQRAHLLSSIRGFPFQYPFALGYSPCIVSQNVQIYRAFFPLRFLPFQTFSRDGRRKDRTRLRTCQPCESYQMDHRLIRSSYLVCQQDVALSTCLLQVWQYRSLCWSVILGEKET